MNYVEENFSMDGFDETVIARSLREMLRQGKVDDLVDACQLLSPTFIKRSLGYERLDEDAVTVDRFLTKALDATKLPRAEVFALAECFSWEYLTSLVHVKDSYAKGASANLDGCLAAIAEVKSSLDSSDSWGLGPDASLSPEQVNILHGAAQKIGEVESTIRSLVENLSM